MRIVLVLLGLTGVGIGVAFSLGCCQSPSASSLPQDESAIRVVSEEGTDWSAPAETAQATDDDGQGWSEARHGQPTSRDGDPDWSSPAHGRPEATAAAPRVRGAIQPASEMPADDSDSMPTPVPSDTRYRALQLEDVKGGEIAFAVPGTPEQVLAMLVDFPDAAGNRAWAESYRVLETAPGEVLAEWQFKGTIFKPRVHIIFRTQPLPDGGIVRFELRKKQLGVASFFGDFRVTRLPGSPPRCRVVERTFIDSGISFRAVKREEIEAGLREDARLIRAWMERRTSK